MSSTDQEDTEAPGHALHDAVAATAADDDGSSLEAAIESEENKLVSMRFPGLRREFYASIEAQRGELEAMISRLLPVSSCSVAPSCYWRSGSFNVAIPVRLLPRGEKVYLRLPLTHRIGEGHFPGNAEEKLRTEIATYLWLQEHCPDVPIPTLHAFGLPDGSVFTSPEYAPWWRRTWRQFHRIVAQALGRPGPIRHVRHPIQHALSPGFLLISEAQGTSLALSWNKHYQDERYKANLFRDLARIKLSMNAIPQPRIGALSLQRDTISLSNRPLNLYMHMLENDGVWSQIPRERTYLEVEPYLADLLTLQDAKLRGQPNAVFDAKDGQAQMAALTALRATSHHFVDAGLRQGPFFLTLTDLHQSNIFVDEQWNVKCIIDLEWTHSLPAQMQTPPYRITSRAVDGFKEAAHLDEYEETLEEYLAVYADEERRRHGSTRQAELQLKTWRNGGFWFFHAAMIPKGMYNLFNGHIQPMYNADHPQMAIFDDVFFWYWGRQASTFIDRKLEDTDIYIDELRKAHRGGQGCV
ncbi:Aminoglycoside phosphotransferase [Cordyceps fumosorosea ARSEF 2679]|uniref:Aminoglycoside phosphotransferase n=1 Tax=Cordyceps fumosorosea (strain ARSEF 2679) TaxID=1081104 RepID=A0A167Q2I6_CORFA|nr:Aminoglycoside phosphotransferase [Cordyceps fumosorosea ARSEF 2679]OAA57225.1 Aminoglycoside phosphotransferase [Cordyceps fumosorosea ARSEF 2679]